MCVIGGKKKNRLRSIIHTHTPPFDQPTYPYVRIAHGTFERCRILSPWGRTLDDKGLDEDEEKGVDDVEGEQGVKDHSCHVPGSYRVFCSMHGTSDSPSL